MWKRWQRRKAEETREAREAREVLVGMLARRLSLRLASLLQEALKVGFCCLQRGQRPKREARRLDASLRYEARLSCNKGVKVTIKLMRIAKGAGCAEDDRWARELAQQLLKALEIGFRFPQDRRRPKRVACSVGGARSPRERPAGP